MTRPPDATRSSGATSSPGSAPSGRQTPPSSPTGARPGPPIRPPGPRFAPPPPRRSLTPTQGSRLGLIALVIIMLGTAAGMAVTLPMQSLYAAKTQILYSVSAEDSSDNLKTNRDLSTQVTVVTTRAVLGPVADANGITVDDLSKDVSAELVGPSGPDTQPSGIIEVTVVNPVRETGVQLADAIGKQYLKVTEAGSPTTYLQGQLDDARKQLATGTAATSSGLQARIMSLQGQLDTQAIAGTRASILTPPYSVTTRVFPNPAFTAATGALCGIVLAALVAIWLSRRWTRS